MKHLSILVPEGQNNLSSIVGAFKIFNRANSYWKEKYGEEPFKVELVGLSKRVDFHQGMFSVNLNKHINDIEQTNLIVIPSLNHNYQMAIEGNGPIIEWIEQQYHKGAEVASICTGAFLLATTGLLNGKVCSTHWAFEEQLQQLFPNIKVETDRLITHEDGIYTNGGAYSFLNLILYLIEKHYDRQAAIFCSKVFQIELDRHSQSEFIIFKGQKKHNDEVVIQAQMELENSLQAKVSVEELANKFAISRRNFDRRFIKATGNTPLEYAQRVKMEAAKKAFESTRKSINEVMYEVGYTDTKAFREVFKKLTGLSPSDYRTKYNKHTES